MDFLILFLIVTNIFLGITYFVVSLERLDRRYYARTRAQEEEERRQEERRNKW
ncbi:MAG: hypothetical protein AAGA47_02095 [Pseudomonadota bacterium]